MNNVFDRLQEHHDNQLPNEDDNLCLRCHEEEAILRMNKMKITRYRITIEDLSTDAVQELPLSADAEYALISCQRLSKLLNSIDYRVTLESVDYVLDGAIEKVEINNISWGE